MKLLMYVLRLYTKVFDDIDTFMAELQGLIDDKKY